MDRFQNILVATDTRLTRHPIFDEALALAERNRARLCLVDVVREFPWTVRMTLHDHQHLRELIAEEKLAQLDKLAEPGRQRGLDVTTRVLLGRSSEEIIREVRERGCDLVMRVAKGQDSHRHGFFGSTAVRLLRHCPCAVWLVSPNTTPRFEHVLGCVDTSSGDDVDPSLNSRIVELARSLSHYGNGRYSLLHAWSIWNEQMLRSRMSEQDFTELKRKNARHVSDLLEKFLAQHGAHAQDENVHLCEGDPADVIPEFIRQHHVDLVVMGTVARKGLAGMVIGNTAEMILSEIECSVLALKPAAVVT